MKKTKTPDEVFEENRRKIVKKHKQQIEWIMSKNCPYMEEGERKKIVSEVCRMFGRYATDYSMEAVSYMYENISGKLACDQEG